MVRHVVPQNDGLLRFLAEMSMRTPEMNGKQQMKTPQGGNELADLLQTINDE